MQRTFRQFSQFLSPFRSILFQHPPLVEFKMIESIRPNVLSLSLLNHSDVRLELLGSGWPLLRKLKLSGFHFAFEKQNGFLTSLRDLDELDVSEFSFDQCVTLM
jgi:hypothetical protein